MEDGRSKNIPRAKSPTSIGSVEPCKKQKFTSPSSSPRPMDTTLGISLLDAAAISAKKCLRVIVKDRYCVIWSGWNYEDNKSFDGVLILRI